MLLDAHEGQFRRRVTTTEKRGESYIQVGTHNEEAIQHIEEGERSGYGAE